MDNIGEGEREYYNMNIPWDADRANPPKTKYYLYAFDDLICPMLAQFNAELIFVSCGFDAKNNEKQEIYINRINEVKEIMKAKWKL